MTGQPPAQAAVTQDPAKARAEHIRRLVDAAPPLSAGQIAQLRGLLPAPAVNNGT